MRTHLALVALCVGMSACTYSENGCTIGKYCLAPFNGGSVNARDWTPTAHASGPLEVTAAKCDMLAHGTVPTGGGAFAIGSPAFVSGAMAGAALQQGMTRKSYVQNTIRNCMVMNGFERSQ